MADRLTEKITQTLFDLDVHHPNCSIWSAYPCDCQADLAADLVATFRTHRMNLPIQATADARIEAEIRERGKRIRRRPVPAFFQSLRRPR